MGIIRVDLFKTQFGSKVKSLLKYVDSLKPREAAEAKLDPSVTFSFSFA